MILVWNDAKSFRQHLESMRIFHQTHPKDLEGRPAPLKGTPPRRNNRSQGKHRGQGFTSARGRSILIPVREIVLPKGSQN